MGTKRDALVGTTKMGTALRAILLAALIGAASVAADHFPALRPFLRPLITIFTGVPAVAPAPEKAAPPANQQVPNQMAPDASKKG